MNLIEIAVYKLNDMDWFLKKKNHISQIEKRCLAFGGLVRSLSNY